MPTNANAATPCPTLRELMASGYAAALALDDDGWYDGMADALTNAARAAGIGGDQSSERALAWLGAICALQLSPETPATPFLPAWRGFAVEDLSGDELDLLAGFLPTVTHPQLRARVADLLWTAPMKRDGAKREIDFARAAIDAYMATPLDDRAWWLSGHECWHRALQLAQSMRDAERVAAIEHALLAAFRDDASASDSEPRRFLEPLYALRGGSGEGAAVADRLSALGGARRAAGNLVEAERYYDDAAKWYGRARSPERHAAALAGRASAIAAMGDAAGVGIAAQHWYTKAIEVYRLVPRRLREPNGVDAAIETLRHQLAEAGRRTVGELSEHEIRIDVSGFTATAVAHVRGRATFIDALRRFCHLRRTPVRAKLFEEAAEMAGAGHISRLFGGVTIAADGRQVARHEGAGAGGPSATELHAAAVKACALEASVTAQALILPALEALRLEWRVQPRDFADIIRLAPLVPRARVDVVSQALHAGWQGDWVQALHILVPQFEHMVRVALQAHGAVTTTHDPDGLDTEIGLAKLVERPQMLEGFGEDLTFTIRAMLCEQLGPNLRNDIAHGLAGRAQCEGPAGVYVWWLILSLIIRQHTAMSARGGAGAGNDVQAVQ